MGVSTEVAVFMRRSEISNKCLVNRFVTMGCLL